ncbi:protein phosphatase [Halobacteriales archaeon SW_8_65_20]|nr:MAG: protein phosphatase [Halobacteriales archaeon SW_6_65_46]PSQ52368.1 MAG: protein phosphatase [Halobacteriales archaeon SW_8_65_20]
MYNFAPAVASGEKQIVYGACRPAHPTQAPADDSIGQWCHFMRERGIKRVCCLLDDNHLSAYDSLLTQYQQKFGDDRVCSAPIPDFEPVDADQLHNTILPFLRDSRRADEPVVVHCSAGSGRTGHVLVLWLAEDCGYNLDEAIELIKRTGRYPLEGTTRVQLSELLE